MKKKTSSLHVDNGNENDNNNSASSGNHVSRKGPKSLPKSSILYAGTFFACMVVMELALEGANNAFPDLDSLPYAVTMFQFGFCFLLPIVVSKGEALASFPKTPKGCIPYISLSVVVFGSTCLASMSVRYVSYPTKVVFKSTKLIPTMIIATFLHRGSNYSTLDYLAASMLCAGAAGYGWQGGNAVTRGNSYTGVTLLLVSVICDAFTPNIQQRLMAPPSTLSNTADLPCTSIQKNQSTSLHKTIRSLFFPTEDGGLGLSAPALMTNANGVGCMGLLMFMTISGSLVEAVGAAMAHPFLLGYLTVIGLALATAVLSYTRLIQESGSVVAVGVATLRKVATVVLSYIVYPKAISMIHVFSGFLVLGGILLSSYSKQRSGTKR